VKMFEKGLAVPEEEQGELVSGNCQTSLANEQVVTARCWRHEDTIVEAARSDSVVFADYEVRG